MEESLTHDAFTKLLETKFQTQFDETRSVELKLIEVSEMKLYPGQEQFAIVLLGPSDSFLGQGTRSFTHDQIGQFEMFIVPIKQDEQGFHYEAVFNRVRK